MGLEKKLFLVLEHMLLGYTSASLPLSVENVCLTCRRWRLNSSIFCDKAFFLSVHLIVLNQISQLILDFLDLLLLKGVLPKKTFCTIYPCFSLLTEMQNFNSNLLQLKEAGLSVQSYFLSCFKFLYKKPKHFVLALLYYNPFYEVVNYVVVTWRERLT